jgi:hypothetical protein
MYIISGFGVIARIPGLGEVQGIRRATIIVLKTGPAIKPVKLLV